MGYNVGPGDPVWTADDFQNALERGVAVEMKSQGIATQSAYAAFTAALTQAQAVAVVKRILATVRCSVP